MSSYQLSEDQRSIYSPTSTPGGLWSAATEAQRHGENLKGSKDLVTLRQPTFSGANTSRTQYPFKQKESESGSETEKEPPKMSARSAKHNHHTSPSSSRKERSTKAKSDDWSEVTEPEERRRIQNRIAQRKFREKAREQKDRAQREAQNQRHAGSSYHIPFAHDIPADGDGDLSGLPWGSFNMRHVVAKGHRSSRSTSSLTNSAGGGNSRTAVQMMDLDSADVDVDVDVDDCYYSGPGTPAPAGYLSAATTTTTTSYPYLVSAVPVPVPAQGFSSGGGYQVALVSAAGPQMVGSASGSSYAGSGAGGDDGYYDSPYYYEFEGRGCLTQLF
ncbi:hypothetical protein B0T22DRAFT_538160 [Podospora appendiculata]|uniref:BZIP domain-containing protein n=1 Tax=Podospora appendiculata TaxID=314037 RepID=A0AAE0X651_9PEZI|nr:hypothetical protein B0T22DRAFT_538160 [Podospora appendiculata]